MTSSEAIPIITVSDGEASPPSSALSESVDESEITEGVDLNRLDRASPKNTFTKQLRDTLVEILQTKFLPQYPPTLTPTILFPLFTQSDLQSKKLSWMSKRKSSDPVTLALEQKELQKRTEAYIKKFNLPADEVLLKGFSLFPFFFFLPLSPPHRQKKERVVDCSN